MVKQDIESAISEGQSFIGDCQQFTFYPYTLTPLAVDGFVFLVKAAGAPKTVTGTLHFSTDADMQLDQNIAINKVVFSTNELLADLNSIHPAGVLLADSDKGFKFFFNASDAYFDGVETYLYRGDAVYPAMYSSIIDTPEQLQNRQVLSNSTSLWLALSDLGVKLFPSFLVPSNFRPPYGVIEIVSQTPKSLFTRRIPHQLMFEDVRITLFGRVHDDVLDFIANLTDIVANGMAGFGLLDLPTPVDVVQKQTEINILAIKKTVQMKISYDKTYALSTALAGKTLIMSALATLNAQSSPLAA